MHRHQHMLLSIIVPAFNEEKLLRNCLRSVRAACASGLRAGWGSEVVVCDNNSTDATAAIAKEEGAAVVFEKHNQISRARNTGAKAASGDWLLFIDADSALDPSVLADMLSAAESGRFVGGGCLIEFDFMPPAFLFAVRAWNILSRTMGWAAGSFVFCRTDAFREVGGFSQELYAAEEIALSQALKRWGRTRGLGFTILSRKPHLSSGRKAGLYTPREFCRVLMSLVFSPRKTLASSKSLFQLYDGRR